MKRSPNRVSVACVRTTAESLRLTWCRWAAFGGLAVMPFCGAALARPNPAAPSFKNEVMAVISKAGCNQGVCHGNRSGKGGFKLSLRGQEPAEDYLALTQEQFGRRVDRNDPAASLLLRKPLTQVPHEGGQRLRADSPEYRILHQWIAAGCPTDDRAEPRPVRLTVSPDEGFLVAPEDTVELNVRATFDDGSERDVTSLACYEASSLLATIDDRGRVRLPELGECTVLVRYLHLQVPVRMARVPNRPVPSWSEPPAESFIDDHVFAKMRRLRLRPAPLVGDALFLRRLYLDVLGVLPGREEAEAFVADQDPKKRERVLDALLKRPEFADFWALKWADLFRLEEKTLDRKGVQSFHHWLRSSIDSGMPMDEFVRRIISARGSTYTVPPANFYRAYREPLERAEAVAQVFLGTRLQCARCHNHPFDRWTQDDYYSWAGIFSRVRYKVLENDRRDSNDKHEFRGEQIVWMARHGELQDPRSGRDVVPRFLGNTPDARVPDERVPDDGIDGDRLRALARWLTRRDHRQFARSMVNRVWFHLLGRGLVEPVDDFRATNPPSHPELLEQLSDEFAASGFDLRALIRRIVGSSTYQLASASRGDDEVDIANYTHARIRRHSAEVLLDAIHQVTGATPEFRGYPKGLRAVQVPGVHALRRRDAAPTSADTFLRLFGKPERLLACECERSEQGSVAQALQLISGDCMDQALRQPDNRLDALVRQAQAAGAPTSVVTADEIINELFWTALTRAPTESERAAARGVFEAAVRGDGSDLRRGVEDLTWSLLNSKEFLLRR